MRDAMVNNLAKLSKVDERKFEVEKHLAREHQKLIETSDPEIQQDMRDRIMNLERELSDIKIDRESRLEAISPNRAALRSQINRIRETFRRILHEDTTLAESIRTLFQEERITIASILTAVGMAISTLVLALTGGGWSVPAQAPSPKPTDKGNLKEWVKNTATWLAVNLCAIAIAVGTLLLVAARDWLTSPQPKRH